ncbi:hypothetical protein [Mycobacterium sp. Marseille-P9652]|uniref:hypothetical protein n=1 Tax=Mycobacterium sp. Marseille-P9652 TaxID=2654950 RepID=UPI0012E7D6A2|nr:hypothetical protein [Mycobacterium sp. Marseille-P9652]
MVAGVVAGAALTGSLAGCDSKKTGTPSTPGSSSSGTSAPSASTSASTSAPGSAQPNDYTGLLIQASDIDAPIPFTGAPPTANPNGQPGVATTFSNDDGSRIIKDTIQVLADPGAATNALNSAKSGQSNAIKNPTTQPSSVGAGGTTLLGNSPDGSKGVTLLLFTEGRAFVTLEFDGPKDMLAPPDFVTDVGQKQDAAIKKGLGS